MNFPAVSLPRKSKTRLCITATKDVSAEVEKAVPVAASASGMKKGFYMIADTDAPVDENTIKAIDGVTRVRVL